MARGRTRLGKHLRLMTAAVVNSTLAASGVRCWKCSAPVTEEQLAAGRCADCSVYLDLFALEEDADLTTPFTSAEVPCEACGEPTPENWLTAGRCPGCVDRESHCWWCRSPLFGVDLAACACGRCGSPLEPFETEVAA